MRHPPNLSYLFFSSLRWLDFGYIIRFHWLGGGDWAWLALLVWVALVDCYSALACALLMTRALDEKGGKGMMGWVMNESMMGGWMDREELHGLEGYGHDEWAI